MEFEELVGFHDHVNAMIQQLTSGTRFLDVISIVGIAGQGKTALARKVYNDHSIINHFDVRVWCSISKIYNRKKLLLDILKQIKGDKHDNVDDDDSIADMLNKSLMGKTYLIVLDDIWEVKALDDIWEVRGWYNLQLPFPNIRNGNGSRIMVTTRDLYVAKCASLFADPYLLPLLKEEDSWELLQKKVFQGESCPLELLNVGPLVAKKCNGLPSLIITIAGILSRKKEDPSFWLEVAYDISSHASLEESMEMIQSSYDQLDHHLKPCLLYMGLFPKGYQIPVSDLLKWWIAEEFVQDTDTLELEETSKSCLFDLARKNLVIIISKRRTNGEIKCCIILDQVREFCLRKIKEEKFMQSIVPYNPCRHVDSDEPRLCMYIHDTMKTDYKERESLEQRQRPLEFIAHPKFGISGRKNLFPLLNNLRLIRVLHLLDIYLENSWATAFQSLTELRFLAIFVKAFDFKWVSHLLHLQTLCVRSSYIMISPAIWKMEKLRHVDISEFPITMEENEGVNFEESSDIVLHNMKTLGMCYMSVADMTPKFWGKFPNLKELKLNIEDVPNNSCSTLMRSDMFPSSLKVLCLSDIFLTEEIVSNIARLEHLETLKLSEIYFMGKKHWNLSDNYVFKRLRALKLHHVFMTRWIFSEKSFPWLETLVIKSCSKLEEIPYSLRDSETLELIKVVDCSDSVGNSALKIKNERKWPEVDISKKD